MTRTRWALLASAALSLGCGGPALESRGDAAGPAIAALRRGSFDDAERLARERIEADPSSAHPRLVRAIVRYKKAMQQLALDGRTVVIGGVEGGAINQKYLRATLGDAESELAAVEADLAIVAKRPGIALELCLACWDIDWNGDGRIDERDHLLFQIEQDERGEPLPEGDPRRKPTFRFDDGDVAWARAFVSFERAALDVLLAYDWSDVGSLGRRRRERPSRIVVRLVDPARVAEARKRLLDGLAQSDAARRAYLAETDDDREWVPSPRQRSHPMPLPVDQALYDTWEGVVGDVRRLVQGEDGLSAADLMTLAGERAKSPPRGYIDVGGMLARPADIVLDVRELERLVRAGDTEAALSTLLGPRYVRALEASPLPRRLLRMKSEVDRSEGELGRKLRYLLWLN